MVSQVFDGSMEMLNTIRYHDGFLGQRIAAVNCLAFHPYRPLLACGFRYSIAAFAIDGTRDDVYLLLHVQGQIRLDPCRHPNPVELREDFAENLS